MGGKSTTTSSTAIDPAVSALQQGNFARAQTVADAPVTPYTGQLGAQLDPSVGQAQQAATGLLDYNAPTVSAAQLSSTDLTPYLNPYTNDVINASAVDSENQRLIAQKANAGAATAASAYGGTRDAVQAGVTDSQNEIAFATLSAQLRSQGYSSAQAAALADNQLKLQADTSNQGASLASAGVRNTAAGTLGTLGLAATANDQTGLNAQYEEFLRQQQDPLVKQGLLNSSLSGVAAPTTTTTTKPTGGLFGSGINVGWDAKDGLKLGSA